MSELRKNFFWGNSTSSMQTEGAWDEGGKGKSVYDIRPATAEVSDWKNGIDEYHRYKEDFDLMKEMGMNFFRFQISWSRVQPDGEGKFNEEGIQFYSEFINELLKRKITPMICLYHFDMPLALSEKYNGFLSRKVSDLFVKFGIEMVKRFGDRVKYWITFNEQNLYNQLGASTFAGNKNVPEDINVVYQIAHNVMMAHAQIANYIHAHTDCEIGGMLAYTEVYPATARPRDIQVAREIQEFSNNNLLDVFAQGHYSKAVLKHIENYQINAGIKNGDFNILSQCHSDYMCFSYYRSTVVNSEKIPENCSVDDYLKYGGEANPYVKKTPNYGWEIDSLGFRDILNKIYHQYQIPVFPIENGIGVQEKYYGKEIQDDYRINYMRAHIQALKDAVEKDGVDVLGYLGWGLIDIPSSAGDMRKRYGVVYVNRTNHDLKDMKRIPKKSFYWLKSAIGSNGKDL
ncbi:glycoside hydrolase family 1 protein [Pediococcus ethanolidurans]|uniref:6-phospho-beta-glucosidase n=1 Tax=Pediococcus ethanolidurans TaxID=319653 RepID=A0A0R2KAE2_9LACO|nr:glycoside hydrolase family 1 protein [Pediococcus ethanolidurans]KRN83642.1 Beta-glucosidase 6-phospho-beta-glucosidase beta-galactosidase [Pediococcus ethanolidurans]GEN94003.1 6-phospho-beta-glucosidase [Pediococcus ethanolidurans]SER01398.1 6-phospho-beta-glucosidase [Pediococcus ethanolidurans]